MKQPIKKYTPEHEWVEESEGIAGIGITLFASEQLGDIVYIELPNVGDEFKEGEPFGEIESVKAVSDLFMPISGRILNVNEDLLENPQLINNDPNTWIVEIHNFNLDDFNNLMDEGLYLIEIGNGNLH